MPARRYRHHDGEALLLQLKAGHNAARARLASMVHLHLETHAAPPCSRWARLVSTAMTARLGAPFCTKGEPFGGALPRREELLRRQAQSPVARAAQEKFQNAVSRPNPSKGGSK